LNGNVGVMRTVSFFSLHVSVAFCPIKLPESAGSVFRC
jgi:hypothetical protein